MPHALHFRRCKPTSTDVARLQRWQAASVAVVKVTSLLGPARRRYLATARHPSTGNEVILGRHRTREAAIRTSSAICARANAPSFERNPIMRVAMPSAPRVPGNASDKRGRLERIRLDQIRPNPANARHNAGEDLEDLAASIGAVGQVQPALVRPIDGGFELVAGERRWRAARQAGHVELDAVVRELSDREAQLASLAENFHRKKLDPIQKAKGLLALTQPTADGSPGLSQKEIAARFGFTDGAVTNILKLLRLPESWQRRVAVGEIGESTARLLVPLLDKPGALERVEKDMAANPWAWETRRAWEQNLPLIAGDDQAERKRIEPRPPRLPPQVAPATNRTTPASAPTLVVPIAAAADPTTKPSSTVERICRLITELNELPDLAAVKEAVELRVALVKGRRKTVNE
jgi:ParB/RepB/Spo0J family partition protein